MEFEISPCMIAAATGCVVFFVSDDKKSTYVRDNVYAYLKFMLLGFITALIASLLSAVIVNIIASLDFLLPVFLLGTAAILVSLCQRLRFFATTERFAAEAYFLSAILSLLFCFDLQNENMDEFFLRLFVRYIVFILSSLLLFAVTVRFDKTDSKKQPRLLSVTVLSTALLGFAAEGFIGIFEKLFT